MELGAEEHCMQEEWLPIELMDLPNEILYMILWQLPLFEAKGGQGLQRANNSADASQDKPTEARLLELYTPWPSVLLLSKRLHAVASSIFHNKVKEFEDLMSGTWEGRGRWASSYAWTSMEFSLRFDLRQRTVETVGEWSNREDKASPWTMSGTFSLSKGTLQLDKKFVGGTMSGMVNRYHGYNFYLPWLPSVVPPPPFLQDSQYAGVPGFEPTQIPATAARLQGHFSMLKCDDRKDFVSWVGAPGHFFFIKQER
ncbi:hypothetical protein QOT17_011275 [Balamuthia mandrillaris]